MLAVTPRLSALILVTTSLSLSSASIVTVAVAVPSITSFKSPSTSVSTDVPSSRRSVAVVFAADVSHGDLPRTLRRIDELDPIAAIVDAGFDAESVELVNARDDIANCRRYVVDLVQIDGPRDAVGARDLEIADIDAGPAVERR